MSVASPADLERDWTLLDLLDAHDALDVWDELERKQHEAASQQD